MLSQWGSRRQPPAYHVIMSRGLVGLYHGSVQEQGQPLLHALPVLVLSTGGCLEVVLGKEKDSHGRAIVKGGP